MSPGATSSGAAELAALVALGPLMLMAIWWDLRSMRIPNWLTAAAALLFVPYAALFLEPGEAGWRLAAGGVVLAACYLLFFLGKMGGGDAKLLAACALFVPGRDASVAMLMLSTWLAIGLVLVLMAKRAAVLFASPERRGGWASLEEGAQFPMGISIGAAMLTYLALRASAPGEPALLILLR